MRTVSVLLILTRDVIYVGGIRYIVDQPRLEPDRRRMALVVRAAAAEGGYATDRTVLVVDPGCYVALCVPTQGGPS